MNFCASLPRLPPWPLASSFSSVGHHFGLTSTPQVMQTLSPLCGMTAPPVSGVWSADDALWAPVPALAVVVVDARRLPFVSMDAAGIFVAIAIRLALRTVPVSVRSACLKFCANSCSALMAEGSLLVWPSSWLTTSCMRCTSVRVGMCSLHHTVADMVPVSPLMVTMLNWSRLEPLTGVTSKPNR